MKGEAKKALRNVIERYELPVLITPNQNLILKDINPSWRDDILSTLKVGGGRKEVPLVCMLHLLPSLLRCCRPHAYGDL